MLKQVLLYFVVLSGLLGNKIRATELSDYDTLKPTATLNLLERLVDRDLDSAIIIGNAILKESTVSDSILVEAKILLGAAYYDLGLKDTSYNILIQF